jgi:hypothetical protein
MPPHWLQRVRRALIALLFMTGLLFIINILADNPFSQKILRSLINQKVSEYTNLKIDFRAISFQVFPPLIEIYGFKVLSSDNLNKKVIETSHIKVTPSIMALFIGSPKLASVELRDLDINFPLSVSYDELLKSNGKETNSSASSGQTWPPDFNVPVETIIIRNSKVGIDTTTDPTDQNQVKSLLSGIDIELELESWYDINAELAISSIGVHDQESTLIEGASVVGAFTFDGKTIQSKDLNFNHSFIDINAQMTTTLDLRRTSDSLFMTNYTVPALIDGFEMKFFGKTHGDIALLGSLLDIDETQGLMNGEIFFDFAADFASNEYEPNLRVDVQSHDAVLDGFLLLNSTASMSFEKDRMRFDAIEIIDGEHKYGTATGEILFDDKTTYNFDLHPQQLPLPALLKALNADSNTIDVNLSSESVILRGTGDPYVMEVAGTTRADDLKLNIPGMKNGYTASPLNCVVDLKLLINSTRLKFVNNNIKCPSKSTATRSTPALNLPKRYTVELSGSIGFSGFNGLNIELNSRDFDYQFLEHYLPVSIEGRGGLQTRIHGPFDKIKTDILFNTKEFNLQGINFIESSGSLSIDDDSLELSKFRADTHNDGHIDLKKFRLNFGNSDTFEAKLSARNISALNIKELMTLSKPSSPLSFGLKDMDIDISGSIIQPARYLGRVQLRPINVKWNDQLMITDGQIDLSNNGSGWESKKLELNHFGLKSKSTLTHTFSAASPPLTELGLSKDDDISLETNFLKRDYQITKLDSKDLQSLPFISEFFRDLGINANVSGKIETTGKLGEPQINFQTRYHNLDWYKSELAPLELSGFFIENKLAVFLNHAGNSLQGRLSADFKDKSIPYEFFVKANRFDVRFAGTPYFSEDPRNFAYVSGNASLRGELKTWWRSQGVIEFTDVMVKYLHDAVTKTKSVEMSLENPVTLDIGAKNWDFKDDKKFVLTGDAAKAVIDIQNNALPDKMNIKAHARINLESLPIFIPAVETASGEIFAEASLTGSLQKPKITAMVTSRNKVSIEKSAPVSIGIIDARPALENIDFTATYNDGVIDIENFEAQKGLGKINAVGRIHTKQELRQLSQVTVSIDQASLIYPIPVLKSFDSQISGNILISGIEFPLQVSGDIEILKARSISEFDFRENVSILKRRSYQTDLSTNHHIMDLNLRVRADKSISINNRNIQGDVSLDLLMTGNESYPIINGRLEVDRGKFIYKRDFTLTQGLFTFDDPLRINPKIDMSAYADISTYRVTISVTGRSSEPIIDLSIDPPVRDDGTPISKISILTLLSSGSLPESSGELINSSGTASTEAFNVFIAKSIDEIGQGVLDLFGRPQLIRQAYIELESSSTGAPRPTVNTELNMGERLDVVFKFGQDASKVSFEYSLHDNISILGSFDGNNETGATAGDVAPSTDTGVDIRFRFLFD